MKRLIAICCLIGACHATDPLSAPQHGAGGSMLLALVSNGETQGIWALDLPADGSQPDYPPIVQREELDIYAVEYACPLEVLGLRPGDQTLLPAPGEKAQLPPYLSAQKIRAPQEAWSAAPEADPILQATLRQLDLPADHVCAMYGALFEADPIGVQTGEEDNAGIAVTLPDGNVLISAGGQFFLVEPNGGNDPIDIDSVLTTGSSTSTPTDAAFIDAEGVLWLIGDDGRVVSGRFGETLRQVPIGRASRADRRGFDGVPDPIDLFSVGTSYLGRRDGRIQIDYFDGTSWSRQADFELGLLTPRIVRLDRGVVLLSGADDAFGRLLRLRARTGTTALVFLEELPPPPADLGGFSEVSTVIGRLPQLGVIAGNTFFEGTQLVDFRVVASMLLRWDGQQWTRLLETRNTRLLTFLGELGDGVIIYGGRDRVLERNSTALVYHPKAGHCGAITVRDETVLRAVPLGSSHALLIPTDASNMTLLRRTGMKKDHPCL